MTIVSDAPKGAISIGRVVSKTFSTLRRSGWVIWPLVVLVAIPAGVASLIRIGSSASGADVGQRVFGTLVGLFAHLCATVFQIVVIHCALKDLNGEPLRIGSTLSVVSSRFWPVFAIGLLAWIGIVLGFAALVIPGIFLVVRWVVAVPVRIAEGPGVGAALDRSAVLTKGSRWRILALVMGFWLAACVLLMVSVDVAALVFESIPNPLVRLFTAALAIGIPLTGAYGVFACGVAVLYYELRSLREGGDAVQTAAVFA